MPCTLIQANKRNVPQKLLTHLAKSYPSLLNKTSSISTPNNLPLTIPKPAMKSLNFVRNPLALALGHGLNINPKICKITLHRGGNTATSVQPFVTPPTFSIKRLKAPHVCMSIEVGKGQSAETDNTEVVQSNTQADVNDVVSSLEDDYPTQPPMPNPREGLEETFAVLNTGQHECRSCGYVYDQAVGDPFYPVAPGLEFSQLPPDWRCPTCGAAQTYFVSKSIEVAGFAQNQQYGLGGNALTSSQKSILIYGSLLLFFALFLAGYFIQ